MGDEEDPRKGSVLARPAVFMSINPGAAVDATAAKFLMISLEVDAGAIEQLAITHDDGHLMLSGLVQSLAAQDCLMAKVMHQMMEDFYDEDEEGTEEDSEENHNEEVEADDDDYDPDASTNQSQSSDDGPESLTVSDDDYGPDA